MKVTNYAAITAAVSTGTTPVYSAPIPAISLVQASAQLVSSSGSNAGAVTLQASNDLPPAGTTVPFTPTNWSTVPNTSQTVAAGATVLIPTTLLAYQWIRLAWVPTSGAGTITGTVVALGF
jgi:hypothetical protein